MSSSVALEPANPKPEEPSLIHPLLSDEVGVIMQQHPDQSVEEIYQHLELLDYSSVDERGGVVTYSTVRYVETELEEARAEAYPEPENPFTASPEVSNWLASKVAMPQEAEISVIFRQKQWNNSVSVAYQQDLAMLRGEIRTRTDLEAVRTQVVAQRFDAGQKAMAPVLEEIEALGGLVLHYSPVSGTAQIIATEEVLRRLSTEPLVSRLETVSEPEEHAVGYSQTVEGDLDGTELTDLLQSYPFYASNHRGDPAERIALTEPAASTVRTDHLSFKGPLGNTRVAICGGSGATCTLPGPTISNGASHPTGVASILLSDLTQNQDPAFTNNTEQVMRSGVARGTKALALTLTPGSRVVNAYTADPKVHILTQSAGHKDLDPNCEGADFRSVERNSMFESGILPINSGGNHDHSDPTKCTMPSPAAAIGVLAVGAYQVSSAPGATDSVFAAQSLGGTSTEGADRTIMGILGPSSHILRAEENAATTPQYEATVGFNATSGAAPTVAGAAAIYRDWYLDKVSSLIEDPGHLYVQLLHMGDRVVNDNLDSYIKYGFNNLTGAGRLRLRKQAGVGLDAPGANLYGKTCIDDGEVHTIHVRGGSPLPAAADYLKVTTWWYDHDHDDSPGNGHDQMELRIKEGAGPVYSVSKDTSLDNRQRLFANGVGGKIYKIEISGENVTSNGEGCGTGSNMVYFAITWEDNARNDDPTMINYIRPEN